MKNKDVEKKIIAALTEDESSLNPHILDSARVEIRVKREKSKNKKIVFLAVPCAAVLLFLAVFLPVYFLQSKSDFVVEEHLSMYEYFVEIDTPIVTYDHLFDKEGIGTAGIIDTPTEISPYIPEKCELIRSGKTDILIRQKYSFLERDTIMVTVLLTDDMEMRERFLGDYLQLNSETRCAKTLVYYSYDSESGIGKARFVCKGREFFVEITCDSEATMILHLQTFILKQ